MKNAMRTSSMAAKATVFLGLAALLVAGCAARNLQAVQRHRVQRHRVQRHRVHQRRVRLRQEQAPQEQGAAAPSSAAALAPAAATTAPSSAAAGPTGPATVATKMGPLGAYLTDASGKHALPLHARHVTDVDVLRAVRRVLASTVDERCTAGRNGRYRDVPWYEPSH